MPTLRIQLSSGAPHLSWIESTWQRAMQLWRDSRPQTSGLDLENLPADRLRDLGFKDGRGPSLRRAERV